MARGGLEPHTVRYPILGEVESAPAESLASGVACQCTILLDRFFYDGIMKYKHSSQCIYYILYYLITLVVG